MCYTITEKVCKYQIGGQSACGAEDYDADWKENRRKIRRKTMAGRRKRHIRWDRVCMIVIPLLLLILLLSRCGKDDEEEKQPVTEETKPIVTETTPAAVPAAELDSFVVVLDPGHGGKDDGCTNRDETRFEKTDNLNLALATKKALLEYPHVTVYMTREDDESFPSLDERCEIANNANADLFVSLHRNAATEGNGVEIWVNSGDDNAMDTLLAEYIMELLETKGISRNRGIRKGFRGEYSNNDSEGGYYVNTHTNMPSCLVEMGFMSSDADNKDFDEKLDEYGAAIARAIVELGSDKGMYDEVLTN